MQKEIEVVELLDVDGIIERINRRRGVGVDGVGTQTAAAAVAPRELRERHAYRNRHRSVYKN